MISTEEQARNATRDQLLPVLVSIGAIDKASDSSASAESICSDLCTVCIKAENSSPSVQWTTVASLLRAGIMPRLLRLLIDTGPTAQLEQLSRSDSRPVSQRVVPNLVRSKCTFIHLSSLAIHLVSYTGPTGPVLSGHVTP